MGPVYQNDPRKGVLKRGSGENARSYAHSQRGKTVRRKREVRWRRKDFHQFETK